MVKKLTFLILLSSFIFIFGCYGTQDVKIKVKVESKVNMKKYRNVAVLDLVDAQSNIATEQGRMLSRMLRKQIRRSDEFDIMEEKNITEILDENIVKEKIESSQSLVEISDRLNVDALIVGTFDFYQISKAVPYIVERYSYSTGRYSPEARTYIQQVNRLLIYLKLVDGKTGETIFDFRPSAVERPARRNAWGLPFSSGPDPEVLRYMAKKPMDNFLLSLIPHYEYERRILIQ
ncbi:hypothetical protein GF312_10125 [Candidatus Poribacteria bacterium]|nr:hypothetical protein [Candidatus Poribacteria bacterium]